MPEILSQNELETALQTLDGWHVAEDGKRLTKTFEFKNFRSAFAFMTQSAMWAEKLDHHPDWSNSYKTVTVSLSTHSVGGLTRNDTDLAHHMNAIAR